jgi:hypothetical protein
VRTFYIYIQEMYWLVCLLTDFLHFISEGVGGAEILFLRSKGFLEVKEMDKIRKRRRCLRGLRMG